MNADNEIVKFNVQKYIDALDKLIGADHAYYSGDPDVEAIIEIIKIAKDYETIIGRLQAENRLQKYFAKLVQRQKELIDKQEVEIEKLVIQIDGIKEANIILRNNNETAINNAIKKFAEKVKTENYDDCIDVTYDGSGEVKKVELRKALFNKRIDNLICLI